MQMVQKIKRILKFPAGVFRKWIIRADRNAPQPGLCRIYVWGSLAVLLLTTCYWAWLGAGLQLKNADQLVNPYLFSNAATFHGATFPGTHTFLLKWPIFWVLQLFGDTPRSLEVATVAVVLLSVGALAAILYKIERRPYVYGTLCLSLALVLLLIPAQPYAGGLLPVNMAMLTTRNLEYIVYIIALACLIRAQHYRSKSYVIGIALLSLLVASDKLFLSLSGGGALLALLVYASVKNWNYVTLAVRWLTGTILAALGSLIILSTITALHVTHFSSEASASPYAVISSAKQLVLGVSYAVLHLLTNAGANPAYSNTQLSQLPAQLLKGVFSLSGGAYLLAALVFLYALRQLWRLLRPTLRNASGHTKMTWADKLSVSLIWSTVTAIVIFIGTDHYYAVDARYLAIATFALPIVTATALRKQKFRPGQVISLGLILAIGILVGVVTAQGAHTKQLAALSTVSTRNSLIAETLSQHKVDVLLGDYWRVLPVRTASHNKQVVLPLGNCTQPRTVLSSTAWQLNIRKHSFAYLISLDDSLTDFPHCNLAQITSVYGRPTATQLIAGTPVHPKEALLFYDHGSYKNPVLQPQAATNPSVNLSIRARELMGVNCEAPTIVNVVAHEDDDLLFTSPDLLRDIQSGHCVRTIFLTAGDSGQNTFYWLNRQLGSEAAYNTMLGHKAIWVQRTVRLANNEYVSVASPQDNANISLVFLNLPDGGLRGEGFQASHEETLAKLHDGTVPVIHTVDGQSSYTMASLTAAIGSLFNVFKPTEIRTQADVTSPRYPDHSDHIATGQFTDAAAQVYNQQQYNGAIIISVKHYIGYPIHEYTGNVEGKDLHQKEAAFLSYSQYDGSVCHTAVQCADTPTYNAYLSRQYQQDRSSQ
jgi:LmbE family N-acetylglucosaminyl deacetylase